MRGLVGVAVVLGLAGTVLGLIALNDDGGDDDAGTEYEELTLELTGGEERLTESEHGVAERNHVSGGVVAYGAEQQVSGDRTGEWVRVCQPIIEDDFQCTGAFLLEDGEIEVVNTQDADAAQSATAPAVVVGGTGAYEGARGTVEIAWEDDTYTLNLEIPETDD